MSLRPLRNRASKDMVGTPEDGINSSTLHVDMPTHKHTHQGEMLKLVCWYSKLSLSCLLPRGLVRRTLKHSGGLFTWLPPIDSNVNLDDLVFLDRVLSTQVDFEHRSQVTQAGLGVLILFLLPTKC